MGFAAAIPEHLALRGAWIPAVIVRKIINHLFQLFDSVFILFKFVFNCVKFIWKLYHNHIKD